MDWVKFLEAAGPYSTPLCGFMFLFGGAVMRWLLKDRDRLLALLKEATDDAKQLRDKRTEDRDAAAQEFKEYGSAMGGKMEAFAVEAKAALAALGARS